MTMQLFYSNFICFLLQTSNVSAWYNVCFRCQTYLRICEQCLHSVPCAVDESLPVLPNIDPKFERDVLGQRRNSEKCLRRSRRQVAMACIDYRLGSNHFPLREGFRVGMFYLLCTVDVHAGWLAEFEFVGGGGELCFLASLFPHETVVSFSLSLSLRRDGLPSHSTKDCHCVRVEGEV